MGFVVDKQDKADFMTKFPALHDLLNGEVQRLEKDIADALKRFEKDTIGYELMVRSVFKTFEAVEKVLEARQAIAKEAPNPRLVKLVKEMKDTFGRADAAMPSEEKQIEQAIKEKANGATIH